MENASKALLMAGGIFIALMIIGSIIMLFTNLSDYQSNQDELELTSQIAEFNNQYEPYMKEDLSLMELQSVYNKILDNNKQAEQSGTEDDKIKTNIGDYITDSWSNISTNDKKTKRFKCSDSKYRSDGRIKEIYFEQTK